MTILNEVTIPSLIIVLWIWAILLSVFALVVTLVTERGFKHWWSLILCISIIITGILGCIFWTPQYKQIQVYADENFSISQVQDTYTVRSIDGLIVTLEEK